MTDDSGRLTRDAPLEELHPNERLKHDSNYLRGTLQEGLADPITGGISEQDNQLLKFHGIYQQDDRDLRSERRHQKLEPAYQFMVRVRLPGGVCTTGRWLKLDSLANDYADGSLRLTTRQTFQFHGVLKGRLKPLIRGMDEVLLDTIAACGDDNRGVMCAANPEHSRVHARVFELSRRISERLLPRSRAWHEIWLDEEPVSGGGDGEQEPLYGRTYLPRKFKIGLAVPPVNDIDVHSQDIGFIAIEENGELAGFNVCLGGGMGRTDHAPDTYPRLADVVGFCSPEQAEEVAEAVVSVQRDHGNRLDRKRARMKYTIEDLGLDWFVAETERRLGWRFGEARPFRFHHNGDAYGWTRADDGRWHYCLFIENGRVRDREGLPLMTGLRKIAESHDGEFRITPNQNLIIANVAEAKKPEIDDLLKEHRLLDATQASPLRRNAMACVALPTCGLAMAESERYLPDLVGKLEAIMAEAGIADEPIVVRMTGCPNGCARPYLAEIGFSGRGPGKYDLYLGGSFRGDRLNKPYLENINEDKILEALSPILHQFARERQSGERFGDFVIRAGYVPEVKAGRDFNR
jgi:sulfite reductase (NADPH) hemoprotein beta-component